MSSVSDDAVRRRIGLEIGRDMPPGGAVIWFEMPLHNPSNRNVRKVPKQELLELSAPLHRGVNGMTLAPPPARIIAPISWPPGRFLPRVTPLTSHLLAVVVKQS